MPKSLNLQEIRAVHELYKTHDASQDPHVVTAFPPQMSRKGRDLVSDISMLLEDPALRDVAEKELSATIAKLAGFALSGGKSC